MAITGTPPVVNRPSDPAGPTQPARSAIVVRPQELAPGVPEPVRGLRLPQELRGSSRRSLILTWLTGRMLALSLAVWLEPQVTGDVQYYARSLHALFHGGSIRETLQEYPLPVLAIMLPQYLLGALNSVAFVLLFGLSMLAVDAIFTWSLWRASGRTRSSAITFWLWFVPAIGPMAYFRFDLVPAMLAGAAVLAAARRPGWSGTLTAIGSGLKLWPALMLPTFLLVRSDRKRVTVGFTLTGVVILGASLAIGGIGRVLSPLDWQADRGLQIESIAATPLMIARVFHRHHVWNVKVSQYKAWEIFGWGVHPLIWFTTVATAAGLVLLGWLWLRARRLPAVTADVLGWLFLATSVVVTVTNKTLSPQYILWLGGPLAALMARFPGDVAVRRACGLMLAICALTQGVYPLTYSSLESGRGLEPVLSTGLLLTRNILLLVLAWQACRQVWLRTNFAVAPVASTDDAPRTAAVEAGDDALDRSDSDADLAVGAVVATAGLTVKPQPAT
jgi:glycosyl transferase family 87